MLPKLRFIKRMASLYNNQDYLLWYKDDRWMRLPLSCLLGRRIPDQELCDNILGQIINDVDPEGSIWCFVLTGFSVIIPRSA